MGKKSPNEFNFTNKRFKRIRLWKKMKSKRIRCKKKDSIVFDFGKKVETNSTLEKYWKIIQFLIKAFTNLNMEKNSKRI